LSPPDKGLDAGQAISRCFDGQKPDRSVRFPSFVAALYGVTREAIRLAVNAALLEPDQLAA
jgi:hypothetical protein